MKYPEYAQTRLDTGLGNMATTSERWLQRQGTGVGTTATGNLSSWVMGSISRVPEIRFYSSENLGSVTVQLYKNGSSIDSVAKTVNAGMAVYQFTAGDYAAGDRLQVSVTCGSAPAGTGNSAIEIVVLEQCVS